MTARDIKLAQAASLMELGDDWMGRAATPNPRTKYTHACRLFEQAADTYRTFGRWRLAGEAYFRCAEAEKMQAQLLIASTYYTDAGECLERVDANEAVLMYRRAVGLFASLGRFVSAATLQVRVAELFEADSGWSQAAEAYQLACDYFLGDDLYSQGVQALHAAGTCLARMEDFDAAADKFDRAAAYALDDNLLKLRVPEFMFDACLCRIAAGDLGVAEAAVADCALKDAVFAGGRERRFLLDAIDCARARAMDEFADHCWNYDFATELDPWEIGLLMVLMEMMQAGPVVRKEEDSTDEEDDDGGGGGAGGGGDGDGSDDD